MIHHKHIIVFWTCDYRPLDHEQQAEFRFLAVATDSGMPARSSSALVHIVVLDINDNPPVFLQPSFSCYITDQAQRRQLVTKVMAEDADDSDKGRLSYSIIGGNEKQAFTINSTSGLITVSEQRKPDFSPAYVLSVSVSDGFYTSFARVSITVRNTNKHTPRFSEETYYVEVSEMHPKGKTVIALSAMDNDRGNYGMLTYTLPSQHMADIFSIDADTGEGVQVFLMLLIVDLFLHFLSSSLWCCWKSPVYTFDITLFKRRLDC